MTDLPTLFQTVKTTILAIDAELKTTNKTGVFFAPELYTAFCMGRDICKDRLNIFGTHEIEWLREFNLGNGGPSDIVFKTANYHIVFELKLRETGYAYQADIEKLKKLPVTDEKFICVLIDTIPGKYDRRINYLKSKYENEIVNVGQYSFPTWNNRYSKIDCHLNLYKVL